MSGADRRARAAAHEQRDVERLCSSTRDVLRSVQAPRRWFISERIYHFVNKLTNVVLVEPCFERKWSAADVDGDERLVFCLDSKKARSRSDHVSESWEMDLRRSWLATHGMSGWMRPETFKY